MLIQTWTMLANKLSLNVTKTEYMFIGTNFKLFNLGQVLPIYIGNKQVRRVESTRYLGTYVDHNLKWNKHIDHLCKKVCRSISGLKQVRSF